MASGLPPQSAQRQDEASTGFWQVLRALQQSEARLRAVVLASSPVVYRMSPDWGEMQELYSQGFLQNTETPSRSWIHSYIPPEDQPRVAAAIAQAIETQTLFQLEHRVRRADGTVGWTLSRAVPLLADRCAEEPEMGIRMVNGLKEGERPHDVVLALVYGHASHEQDMGAGQPSESLKRVTVGLPIVLSPV